MAIIKPTAGKFSVEGSDMSDVIDITLNVNIDNVDTTAIGVTWRNAIELHKGWSVAVTCNYNPTDTAQAAAITGYTSGDATFTSVNVYETASVSHSGSALLTSAVITRSVGSPDKLTLNYLGNSTLSHA